VDDPFFIDVWSDVVCPFCYLGHRQLAQALSRFEHADVVRLRYRAFELDPAAKTHYDYSLDELVARKYGLDTARAHALHERLEAQAAQFDMAWSLSTAQPSNTFDAHRLIALAVAQGQGSAAVERLFAAYFRDSQRVSDHAVLATLGSELDLSGVDEMLNSDAFTSDVRGDEADALELGISGVPALLLDRRFMINGAVGDGEMLAVLRRAWARRAVV
jgi:predicted DsbA family dithiol-disulfide isomerase